MFYIILCVCVCVWIYSWKSKVCIHLAESSKCELFYQNKKDHKKCMLFFIFQKENAMH